MQNLSTVIFKFLFCSFYGTAQAKNPAKQDSFLLIKWRSLRELIKQNAPDFSEAFHHSERGIRTLDTAGMNRML